MLARIPASSPLPRSFYARPVLTVAKDCIGQILVHRTAEGEVAGRIVEVEAYRGPEDRAAHSYGGRRTRRTEAMFGPAGHAYVFFVYGMHWNFNLVTGEVDEPHAILIRALEPLWGTELMAARRRLPGVGRHVRELTNGPGKLCQAFGITGAHYGLDLCQGDLHLIAGTRARVARSPRIGIAYAGAWQDKPWRFFEAENPYVSGSARARLVVR